MKKIKAATHNAIIFDLKDLSLSIATHTAPINAKMLPKIKNVVEHCSMKLPRVALKKDERIENSVIKTVIMTRTFP